MRIAIIELKCTCNHSMNGAEIVKVEAVACEISDELFSIRDSLHVYVKPSGSTELTSSCGWMTGVDWQAVNQSNEFKATVRELEIWLERNKIDMWCSWENSRSQFIIECRVKGVINPVRQINHIDLKRLFSQTFGHRVDVARAFNLRRLGAGKDSFNGIDDVQKVTKLIFHDEVFRKLIVKFRRPR